MIIDDYTKRLSECGYKVYRPSATLAFALKGDKFLYMTPFHLFRVKWESVNYRRRMNELRDMVIANKMTNVVDLIEFCSPVPGKRSQMYGLPMEQTKIEYHIGEWA